MDLVGIKDFVKKVRFPYRLRKHFFSILDAWKSRSPSVLSEMQTEIATKFLVLVRCMEFAMFLPPMRKQEAIDDELEPVYFALQKQALINYGTHIKNMKGKRSLMH